MPQGPPPTAPPAAARGDGAASAPRRASDLVGAAALRPLAARTDGPGAVLLGLHLVLLAATTCAVLAARGTPWLLPAWLGDGVVIAHLFALQHETAHGTAFASRRANRIITTVAGAAIGVAPRWFRLEHIAHHANTQEPARDPQLIAVPTSRVRWAWFLAGGPFWIYTASTLLRHAAGRLSPAEAAFVPPAARRAVRNEARWMVAGWAAAAVVPLALGSDIVLLAWVVPRVIGEPVMRLARLSEHAGRPQTEDITVNTRTLDVPLPLRLLAWNMPYHAEHHAMPAVPFHALPRLRAALDGHLDPRRGGYLAAQRDVLRQVGARRAAGRTAGGTAG